MTWQEFINSQEYHNVKRSVYHSSTLRNVKDMAAYAHQKAMKYFKLKFKQQ